MARSTRNRNKMTISENCSNDVTNSQSKQADEASNVSHDEVIELDENVNKVLEKKKSNSEAKGENSKQILKDAATAETEAGNSKLEKAKNEKKIITSSLWLFDSCRAVRIIRQRLISIKSFVLSAHLRYRFSEANSSDKSSSILTLIIWWARKKNRLTVNNASEKSSKMLDVQFQIKL